MIDQRNVGKAAGRLIRLGALIALVMGGNLSTRAEPVAYWRFEEGPAGSDVLSEDDAVADSSGHGNHLRSAWFFSTPAYISDTPFRRVGGFGDANELALSFSNQRSLYTTEGKPLNSYIFEQWTLEASFKAYPEGGHGTIVSKEGDSTGVAPSTIFLRKEAASARLEVGILDGLGIARSVRSLESLEAYQWYSAAATATAGELSLWLKGPGDLNFQLQGTVSIEGAFFNGVAGTGHTAPWMVGQGRGGSVTADYFQGVVDEIRISDAALDPSQFLAFVARTSDPAELEVRAVRADRTEDGVGREFLAMETWAPEPAEEFRLEESGDLIHWEEIPFLTETVGIDGEGRNRLRLISDIRLDEESRRFLRSEVILSPSVPEEPANPIFTGADPDALLVGDMLWVYPTFGGGRFYAFSSQDLVHWTMHGPLLYFWEIDWIESGRRAWAPGIAEKNGKFYLYYSVGPKPSHIGVAVSDSPGGPFDDSGGPLLSDDGEPGFEAIDAMVFTDPVSGKNYFYAGGSAGATMRVFELAEDMISFAAEIPVPNPVNFTEGAFMHQRNGLYYLSYSHGFWRDQSYSVHYSTASRPTGPWTYRGAILVSDDNHKGPGHHSIFYNPGEDQWYIVYHRWNDRSGSGPYSGERQVAIELLKYDSKGMILPIVMTDGGVGPVTLGLD